MKPLHAGFAVACLLAMGLLVVAGGRALNSQPPAGAPSESDIVVDTDLGDVIFGEEAQGTEPDVPEARRREPALALRPVEPDIIAPPEPEPAQLERLPAREPLSELSRAVPPRPKPTAEWQGVTLFRPVAGAAGRISAQDLSVTIAGIDPVAAGETCTDHGTQWPCGARATTAFRALLRGRAVICDIPQEAGSREFTARCRLGKQDLGEWLVANGWARADANGPYAQAAQKAQKNGKGIYGHAPDLSGLPPAPPSGGMELPVTPDSIIELPGPAESGPLMPPDGLPEPSR